MTTYYVDADAEPGGNGSFGSPWKLAPPTGTIVAFDPQGTVGDYINFALVELWLRLKELGAYPVLQIHDEIVVECGIDQAEAVRQLMHEVIERPLWVAGEELVIPLESKICKENWLQ